MRDTAKYGQYYFCAKVSPGLSQNGEIYLMADEVEISAEGGLVFWRKKEGGPRLPNLILAKGQWAAVYAASMFDGSAVAVDHWKGEVVNEWSEEDPKEARQEAKARQRREIGDNRIAIRKALGERDGFKCAGCGTTDRLQIDHVWPLSEGGSNDLDNLQFLCQTCNLAKGVAHTDYRQP